MSGIINMRTTGDLRKTRGFLSRIVQHYYRNKLEHYGELGVQALKYATPKDTGATAEAWSYEIVEEEDRLTIWWKNSHTNKWANIAILLQYGHATGTGGFVEGIDYINPALRPVFQLMANEVWKEVIG